MCDCQLSWLPKWLRDEGFEGTVTGKCAHPEKLAGRSIFEISLEEFDCGMYIHCCVMYTVTMQTTIGGKKQVFQKNVFQCIFYLNNEHYYVTLCENLPNARGA